MPSDPAPPQPPARRRHRVAVVGNGGIYRLAHGPAWARSRRAQVVATCDVDAERARKAREETGAEAHFGSLDDLLDRGPEVDVVDLCTPSDTHADLAVRALRAGKHVICEKPMALHPADAARMVREAEAARRQVLVGHTRRFDPRWVALRQQIAAGAIGAPLLVRRSERCWGGFPAGDWHWDVRRSGGVLMDLGVHVADLFAWFLDARPQTVYARALTVRPEAKDSGCPDVAMVMVGFPGGKRGLLEVSWAHPQAYAPYYSDTEVLGTKGKLTLSDRDTAPMTVIGAQGLQVPRYSPLLSTVPEAFDDELAHFLDCIEGSAEPRITTGEASTAVAVIAAAYESLRTGEAVPVEGA